MPISLVPESTPTPANEEMSEDAARAYLASLRGEKLDAFRVQVGKLRTSEIVMLSTRPDLAFHAVGEPTADELRNNQLVMAAILALGDELDRRVPVPT